MKLGHAFAAPERLDDLPDAVIGHPPLTPLSAARAIANDEHRIAGLRVVSVVQQILRDDRMGFLHRSGTSGAVRKLMEGCG
jgi:hypothetical protein